MSVDHHDRLTSPTDTAKHAEHASHHPPSCVRFLPDHHIDVDWLQNCVRFRQPGMPLADIWTYVELVKAGDGNETDRMDVLRRAIANASNPRSVF
jgi:hypothetical protein